MELLFLVAIASIFVFTLIILLAKLFESDSSLVKARIKRIFSKQQNSGILRKKRKKGDISARIQLSLKGRILKNLSNELFSAGVRLRAEEFITIWIMAACLPAVFSFLLGADLLAIIALIIAGVILPAFFVKRAKSKRFVLLEQQLGDALIIMSNCLRTGLSFQQSMDSIARDMPEPISKEFGRVSREIQLGQTMEIALENMVRRINSKDFTMIVSAVLIQRQVGGNLSEILDSISDTIRDRLKIKGSIKVLTATGRTSGLVIGLMPMFIMFILMLLNPPYVKSFFETQAGTIMLIVGAVLESIGFLLVKKIVTIKF